MIEKITPDNKTHWLNLRLQDVTSTETSALFGLSPYMTEFELWHTKKNQEIVAFDENERMKWGNLLEGAIAQSVIDDNKWVGSPLKDYWRLPDLRIGSSFDWQCNDGENDSLIEVKNVDGLIFRQKWQDENNEIEIPPHIEIQIQHQMLLTEYPYIYLAVLVGGNDLKLIKRERHELMIERIKHAVRNFWSSIDRNEPPDIDFNKDSEYVIWMNRMSTPGKVVELPDNSHLYFMAEDYKDICAEEKEIVARKKAAKAKIMLEIGDAEKITHERFSISAGQIKESHVNYTRSGYRNFKVNWRKVK